MSSSDSSWGINSAFCLSKLFQSKERKNRCCLTSYAPPWGGEWRKDREKVLNYPPSKGKHQFLQTTRKTENLSTEKWRSHGNLTFSFYNQTPPPKSSHNLLADLILLTAVAMPQFFSVNFSMTSSLFQRLMMRPLKITLCWTWGPGHMLAQSRLAHYISKEILTRRKIVLSSISSGGKVNKDEFFLNSI